MPQIQGVRALTMGMGRRQRRKCLLWRVKTDPKYSGKEGGLASQALELGVYVACSLACFRQPPILSSGHTHRE